MLCVLVYGCVLRCIASSVFSPLRDPARPPTSDSSEEDVIPKILQSDADFSYSTSDEEKSNPDVDRADDDLCDANVCECTICLVSSPSVCTVEIACSLWEWKRLPMQQGAAGEWSIQLTVPIEGPVPRFKFVVDDEWQVSERYPVVEESGGIINNYLPIEDLDITIDEAEEARELDDKSRYDGGLRFLPALHSSPQKGTPV